MRAGNEKQVSNTLARTQPRQNVKTWGEIDKDAGTVVLWASCRRCGRKASAQTPQDQEILLFKEAHQGRNGVCQYEDSETY
jgi:hypothetical protein